MVRTPVRLSRRKAFLLAVVIAITAGALTLAYFYPKIVKAEAPSLESKFRDLYSRNAEFRLAVDELRRLALDPGVPYDENRAFTLFNSILKGLGLPEVDRLHFRYGKSVKARAEKVPEPVACRLPDDLNLVIVQPKLDVSAGNHLEKVYACEYQLGSKRVVEVTLVFKNEKRPDRSLEDVWYEVWRLVAWGRSRDVETFFLVYEGGKAYVDFSGLALILKDTSGLRFISSIGSGGKGYFESAHETERWELSSARIVVYVNTYNHALGVKDNNPGMEKVVYEVAPRDVVVGRRIDAENEYSDLKYAGEIVSV
ncbi:MAG: hypothetical protein QXT33_03090 [Thermofilum sp.]